MSDFKLQSARLRDLNLSQRPTARALGISPSTLGRYLTRGLVTPQMGAEFSARLDEYIEKKTAALSGVTFKGEPIVGDFYRLEMKLKDLAAAVGLDYPTLRTGIYEGRWEDAATKSRIETYISEALKAKEKTMLARVIPPEEVLEFHNLKRDAFGEPEDFNDLFEARGSAAAERKIIAAADKPAWIVVTAEPCAGKTTLLQKVRERLAKRSDVLIVEPRILQKEALKPSHVIDALLIDIGADAVPPRFNLEYRTRYLITTLERKIAEGKKVLLIIDEAHLLSDGALLALKRIWDFRVGFRRSLAIVLVGQPPLLRRLKGNFYLSEVMQRVSCIEFNAIGGHVAQYVEFRLERAGLNGASGRLFSKDAVKALSKIASTPQGLNNLCNAALIRAHSLGERTISAEIVEEAAAGS